MPVSLDSPTDKLQKRKLLGEHHKLLSSRSQAGALERDDEWWRLDHGNGCCNLTEWWEFVSGAN